MGGLILMSKRGLAWKRELEDVEAGRQSLREAGERMGKSYRQARRWWKRFRQEGTEGLMDRRRLGKGRAGKPEWYRQGVLQRYVERYEGFGPTLAAEKLDEEGWRVDHETLRRWLWAAGLWCRQRKRSPYRKQRPRREHFGELVHLDGSHHRWFGAERPQTCLVEMVDDATSKGLARMEEEETTVGALTLLLRWVQTYGIPRYLYVDRKNAYVSGREPTVQEQLAGRVPLTAVGQVCDRLGIGIIQAHSPQAKGRIERRHGVYQDRLVKELALRGITDIAGANALLERGFNDQINRKFARPPLDPIDFHRPVPVDMDLREVSSLELERAVANDWTVRYRNRLFQILRESRPRPRPRDKVTVRLYLDGALSLFYQNKPLAFTEIPLPPQPFGGSAPQPREFSAFGLPAGQKRPGQSPMPCPALQPPMSALRSLSSVALPSARATETIPDRGHFL